MLKFRVVNNSRDELGRWTYADGDDKENKTPLNQAGRSQMLKGNLKPYYTIHDIIIPKNELDKIWKE